MSSAANLVAGLEIALAIVGGVLLWRLVLSPAARARRPAAALAAWRPTAVEFFTFVAFVLGGAFVFSAIGSVAGKALGVQGDAVTILNGASAQLGMLTGVLWFQRQVAIPAASAWAGPNVFITGAATFLLALPLLLIAAKTSEVLLRLAGLPTEKQDLVGIFANADSPGLVAVMIALAVAIAPLTEELVFRAGLFRFARAVLPRWLALVGPGLFFAALHVNWTTLQGLSSLAPLTLLAVIFSLAYERTGRIGTAIVGHALFNLNTIVLIFSGVGDV
jgi:membrane protease YdiL (CAAX protease family)